MKKWNKDKDGRENFLANLLILSHMLNDINIRATYKIKFKEINKYWARLEWTMQQKDEIRP